MGDSELEPRDDLIREIEALRERLSRLGEAGLRINEDLDFSTVLQGVLDSARSLTGARYGVLVLHDADGTAADFLASGMTPEETGRLWNIPGWPEHFAYLGRMQGPLRVPDLLGHLRSLSLPELVPPLEVSERVAFLTFPVLHRGERVGSIFLAEKESGREFSEEDEETLALFASQAALAIANARRHREEQRARNDLETLVDISPVGVAVFDAATGLPRSFNREARRIVDSLRDPDQPVQDLLEVLTFRRADGRVVSLRDFPVAEALQSGETLRAEEVVISVPDGRSLTLLLNATPIVSEEGVIESMVVTMQDMAEVREPERLRAEFLAMVSHELRVPLTSIKGSATTILDSVADLDPAVVRQFVRIMRDQADNMNALVSDLLDVARIETGALPVNPEPAEAAALVDRARNAFRNAGGRNHLEIDVEPDLPLVTADRRRIVQVLVNLLTNAARHSPESSVIRVSAVREGLFVRCRCPTREGASPPRGCPTCFGSSRWPSPRSRAGTRGWGWPSARG